MSFCIRRPPGIVLLIVFVAGGGQGRFRGGRLGRRDSWFGLESKDGFKDFRRWWHREGKDEAGGGDLTSRDEAERMYEIWALRGKPKAK